MQPEIKTIKEKKLVGKSLKMTLAGNKTGELCRSFMPSRKEIINNLTAELFSLQTTQYLHQRIFQNLSGSQLSFKKILYNHPASQIRKLD